MKCSHCGSRIKKGEEICPNCSKFVSEKIGELTAAETETINYMQTATSETEHISETSDEENGDSVRIFDYKNHILSTLLCHLAIGLFLAVVLVFSAFDNAYFSPSDASSVILAVVFAGFSVFNGISTYIQEKKCIITINDEKVIGTIPRGMFETTDFEVDISDIVCVEKEGFHGKYSTPKIIIITTENRIEIKASSTKILTSFKNALQERIVENEFEC